jgi:Tol biopolymer transport system component
MTAMQLPDRNYRIWRVSPTGETVKLTSDSASYSRLSVDAQGSSLVTTQVKPDFRLMIYQTDNPTAAPRIVGDANTVAFAPDGTLYYSSARTGNSEVWSVGANESDQRQLTNDPAADIVPMLSPDGKIVFFQSDRTGTVHTWRMNPDGTNQRQVTKEEGGFPLRVSPDGQWLYYRSALNGTLRRVAIETGEDEFVLKDVGRNLVVSPDATRVVYSDRRNQETILTVMSLKDHAVEKTFRVTSAPNIAHMTWSEDGRYLAYVLTDDKREVGSLWFQILDGESPRQVADLSGDAIAELYAFSLSKDGKQFAIIKGNWKHDAVLIKGLK